MAAGPRAGGSGGRCVEPGHPLAAPRGHPGGNGPGQTEGHGDSGDRESAGGKGEQGQRVGRERDTQKAWRERIDGGKKREKERE